LEAVHVGLPEPELARVRRGQGRPLFGVLPRLDEALEAWLTGAPVVYPGLGALVAFTGGLLLGADFIPQLGGHMGFPPAWKYREVHELLFEGGTLRRARDLSAAAEDFRRGLTRWKRERAAADPTWGRTSIQRAFSLRYERDHPFVRLPSQPTCAMCGRPFEPPHAEARMCSTACRQIAYQLRKAAREGPRAP
jgi:hypothetical protein